MLFSSITYLFYFFAAFMILYFAVPFKLKNAVLLIFSLIFYAWGGVKYALLMVAAIFIGYTFGLLIEKFREKKRISLAFMWLAVTSILAFMLYFKYTNFFIDNFNKLTGSSIDFLQITLPVGISFYTFQTISYVIDVYRGVPAQKNLIDLAAYVSMFPQLIAGPIVRYVDVAAELKERTHSIDKVAEGIRRFVIGFGKKILIADRLSQLGDILRNTDEKSVLLYWVYGISVALYIYFDFSGYSDMAIGLGKMFGFKFLENFNYPYISKSATEFWRRWHMSLGSWFRDYVYIPLGGNRVSKLRHVFNIFVVWFLTGFWHGAAWNFIIWGLFFGVLLLIEKFFTLKYLEKSKVLCHVYTLLAAVLSFVVFNATDMKEAFVYIGGMFGVGDIPLATTEILYHLQSYAVIFLIAIVGATPIVKSTAIKLSTSEKTGKIVNIIEPIFIISVFLVAVSYLVDGSFSPFLYFRF
ncbi:MAG: MBOAT family protein [Ruminococcaceae bacterium]|nr:MBOAT family protein [Oscillospiraceae bacterium]